MTGSGGDPAGGEVTVALFAAARAAVGCDAVDVQPGSLAEVLDEVGRRHPGFLAVRERCSYLVDGLVVHDVTMIVPGGARVDVLPPFAGG